jgi:hypothetical protein
MPDSMIEAGISGMSGSLEVSIIGASCRLGVAI